MESPWMQEQYIEEVGKSLEGFRKVRDGLYNCKCPICGDSATNAFKRRGYFIRHSEEKGWSFYCHNCGASFGIQKFLKTIDEELHRRYCLEAFKAEKNLSFKPKRKESRNIEAPSAMEQKFLCHPLTRKCSELDKEHDAVKYLEGRKIDREMMSHVLWTDNFPLLVKTVIGPKYDKSTLIEKGILFPVRDFNLNLAGWQIRDIYSKDKKFRFSTCTIDGSSGELCFVPRKLDKTKPVFVVEGCIDSLFLHNSIARLQAALWKFQSSEMECIYFNDQERRNKQVAGEIAKCVSKGLRTVLLDSRYEGMDVNDMVIDGMKPIDIERLFVENSWKGLTAKVKHSKWING